MAAIITSYSFELSREAVDAMVEMVVQNPQADLFHVRLYEDGEVRFNGAQVYIPEAARERHAQYARDLEAMRAWVAGLVLAVAP